MKLVFPIFLGFLLNFGCKSATEMDPLENILSSAPLEVKSVIDQKDKFEVQIRYTQIDRDSFNQPIFTAYEFNVDENKYFYPASTVKMPIAFLALEYVNELRDSLGDDRITSWASLQIDSLREKQSVVLGDSTSQSGDASVAHYVKKIFTVSDNDAYNRLFEIMGREYINKRLQQMGFEGININHRLSLFGIDNRYTPSWRMVQDGEVLYEGAEKIDSAERPNSTTNLIKGKGYIDLDGQLVEEAFDFTHKNRFSIKTLEHVIQSVLFPSAVPEQMRFNLTSEDYALLYESMSILPGESDYPKYDLYDSYVKFFLFGDDQSPMPDHIRIFNKVGDAYGYLTDCAYIVDFKNTVEFLLTATISVNENQIYNDGIYEYDQIGFPFMAQLGKAVYRFELERKREREPDLGRFEVW